MKRVLLTPLDWGLGHATRCIPIITELLINKCEVFIAAESATYYLLKNEFPTTNFLLLSKASVGKTISECVNKESILMIRPDSN